MFRVRKSREYRSHRRRSRCRSGGLAIGNEVLVCSSFSFAPLGLVATQGDNRGFSSPLSRAESGDISPLPLLWRSPRGCYGIPHDRADLSPQPRRHRYCLRPCQRHDAGDGKQAILRPSELFRRVQQGAVLDLDRQVRPDGRGLRSGLAGEYALAADAGGVDISTEDTGENYLPRWNAEAESPIRFRP